MNCALQRCVYFGEDQRTKAQKLERSFLERQILNTKAALLPYKDMPFQIVYAPGGAEFDGYPLSVQEKINNAVDRLGDLIQQRNTLKED